MSANLSTVVLRSLCGKNAEVLSLLTLLEYKIVPPVLYRAADEIDLNNTERLARHDE